MSRNPDRLVPGLLNDSPALCMDGMPDLNQGSAGSGGLDIEQSLSSAGRQEPGLDDDGQDTAVFPGALIAEQSRPDQTTTALTRTGQNRPPQANGGLPGQNLVSADLEQHPVPVRPVSDALIVVQAEQSLDTDEQVQAGRF